jgi:endonuclease/exonuclease/phosphatase family metal-dependent hydrolase
MTRDQQTASPITWMLALLPFSLLACTTLSPDRVERAHLHSTPGTFKVLTYNTLHGSKTGRYWVNLDASREQHQARFELQVKQLAHDPPDLVFLQEVNPLPKRAEAYVGALRARGLEYSTVHQVDACGWRLGKHLALISELNNGLALLAKAPLSLRKIEGLKLSGFGTCHRTWGFQLGELRDALIGEISLHNKKYLLANVHLHSGIEGDAHFLAQLSRAHHQGRLRHYTHLKAALSNDQQERLGELHTLLHELQRLNTNHGYAGLIVAGDFNFEPSSPEYVEVKSLGLMDTYSRTRQRLSMATYDPASDVLSAEGIIEAPRTLTPLLRRESPTDQEAITGEYKQNIGRPRRINFIFSFSFLPEACITRQLFGLQTSATGVAASDHYGVLNTYSHDSTSCHAE